MTIKELYGLCENLGPHSYFTIRTGYANRSIVNDVPYKELSPELLETPIKGFRLDGYMFVIVYI